MAHYTNELTQHESLWFERNIYDDQELESFGREVKTAYWGICHIGLAKHKQDNNFYSLQPVLPDKEDYIFIETDLPCLEFKSVKKRREELLKLILADYKKTIKEK